MDESLVHVVLRAGDQGPVEFAVLEAHAASRCPTAGVQICDPVAPTPSGGVVRVEIRDLLVDSHHFADAITQGRLEEFRTLAHQCVVVVVGAALARHGLEPVRDQDFHHGLATATDRLIDALVP